MAITNHTCVKPVPSSLLLLKRLLAELLLFKFEQFITCPMHSDALETGAVVQVTHATSGYSFRALVERNISSSLLVLCLCSLERPYKKLKVALNGQVSWAVASAKFATFVVEAEDIEEIKVCDLMVYFKAVAHQKRVNRSQSNGWYLGVDSLGLIGDASKGEDSLFRVTIVSTRAAFSFDITRSSMTHTNLHLLLCESQRQSFMQNGYLQIRGAVPLPIVNAALRRINHDLGIAGNLIVGGVEGAIKLAGNTSNSDAIMNLYYLTDVRKYVEALVGIDQVLPPQGAQIALRFPELGPPQDHSGTEWHTDGMRQGRLHPFTLLVGIALSNVPEPLCGNLTVFPGSHLSLQRHLTANGKLCGYNDECYKPDSVWGDGTLPDLGTPVQLLASRGDLVLAHPNLAHRGGLNYSPDIRYQVYFRIKHQGFDELQEQCTTNLWADLQGLSSGNKNP